MAYPHVDHVIERLWRSGQPGERPEVFALLDAARDPRIYALMRRCRLDHRCLYQGALPPELAAAAPYLVNLTRRAPFTRELLDLGWGQSWGICLRSPAILQDLVRHFRKFLLVKDERGRSLFFRFYDPRVLRVYLPTCTPGELRTFFGPVDRFCVEGEEEDTMLEIARGEHGLGKRIVYLGS
jgi:hypothetical protein